MRRRPLLAIRLAVCLLLSPCHLVTLSPCQAFDEVIDSPMYQDPDLLGPRVELVFPEKAKELWLKALDGPDMDTRCKAAGAIALAQRRGVKGLETTVGPLRAALDKPDQDSSVRMATARALTALDARDAAESLLRHTQAGDGELRDLVEPALARWDYRPARAVWLTRLDDATASPGSLVLAMRGLAAVREGQAAGRLREMALSERVPAALRLEAARALGSLRDEGLEADAERLAADTSPRGIATRLAAVGLLGRHRGPKAVGLLQRLAEDSEPAVGAAALGRLVEIDVPLAVPAAERFLTGPDGNPDARLRSLAVEVLRRQPTGTHIELLGSRLNDDHLDVRVAARRALAELAGQKDYRGPVIEQGTRVLAGRKWQGLEQAAVLLTQLDHKPAAGRLVELLATDRRPEVYITAAWGLRQLAVPETLPGVLSHVTEQVRRLRAGLGPSDAPVTLLDHQLSQLNQLLGRQKYQPADEVLRRFIPRMEKPRSAPLGFECRAAAIWALGKIHEGQPEGKLVAALEERLNDVNSLPPEDVRVRRMCAVTLGRLHAQDAVPSLRKYFLKNELTGKHELTGDPVNNACAWAIEQVTGEPMPARQTQRIAQRDWFLSPFE